MGIQGKFTKKENHKTNVLSRFDFTSNDETYTAGEGHSPKKYGEEFLFHRHLNHFSKRQTLHV